MMMMALFFSLLCRGMFFRLIHRLSAGLLVHLYFPYQQNPFNEALEPPTLEQLRYFFHAHPQGKERAHAHIRIGAFSPTHRLLAKIV
jgi:hypothetical protein